MVGKFFQRIPGHILQFGYSRVHERYLIIGDISKFDLRSLSTPRAMQEMVAGNYYLQHSKNPDFEAIRRGVVGVLECNGFKWKAPGMADMDCFRMAAEHVFGVYPVRFEKITFCNADLFMNLMVSTVKKYMAEDLRDRLHVKSQTSCRLDKVCLTPNLEEATARTINRVAQTLHQRYENEKNFRLD